MDHIFSLCRKLVPRGSDSLRQIFAESTERLLICSISSTNVIAFTTETDIEDPRSWGSHVYIADMNTPWFAHKVLSNPAPVTVLQWNVTADLLLVADESGYIKIYRCREHLLNDWNLALTADLPGEHILAAAFFHYGKKICLNSDKKDSSSYTEKFQHVKFACSVKQFGGRPANGALLLTTTGMLAAVLLPQLSSHVVPVAVATESLGASRYHIKTADICYGKNGHFLLAVSSGDINMPIRCYKVQVKKIDDKCIISSHSLPSFFLDEGGKDALSDAITKSKKSCVSHLKWVMREDADSLIVAASSEIGSCLQVWELREKAIPVHKLFSGSEQQFLNTVLWQYQSHFKYHHPVTSVATSKLSISNSVSCGYIIASFADYSIHCLYRDSLKPIANLSLNINQRFDDYSKSAKLSVSISQIDMTWLGNLLVVIDTDGNLHLLKLPPQIESSAPLSIPYVTTMLEYCLVTGLDWLDLLLVVRPGMLDPLCERLTESFNRQSIAVQQFYYVQYLCIKISLYRLSIQGQNKVNDLTQLLMLHSIATAFKSLLRPSEMSGHDKSPADSLASVIGDGQGDVDKVLIYLEAKEFTVEPSTLQSLQQLIQWIADLALNLLMKLPDSRPNISKPYDLLRDVKALNTLREMLVLIRIWGLLRPACLPAFTKSDASLDVLARLFRLLSRLVLNINEPDESLIDDCCSLPNLVQIQPLPQTTNRIALSSAQFFQQVMPLQLEFQSEPECLVNPQDCPSGQTIDSIRHLYLGSTPPMVKQCVRCGGSAGTVSVTRTAAIRAWDQRWSRSCQCGGLWRVNTINTPSEQI